MTISARTASINRDTLETQIRVSVNVDGTGIAKVASGVPFLDHMLDQIARHGLVDLEVEARGDLHIDAHHTVEDIGISIGQALAKALGDKKGLRRYGHAYVPLDEALSRVVVDFSGRPGLVFNVDFTRARIGDFDVDLVREFFQGLVNHALLTLHVDCLRGMNAHHQAETVFKAFGRALRMAAERDERAAGAIPSTKGVLYVFVLKRYFIHYFRMKVVIVDYGMGNLRSVAKAIEKVAPDAEVRISNEASEIRSADRIVVPGQGAMHDCMREFLACGLREVVHEAAATKPFLGICVGMQMLFDHSQEGDTAGLGIVPGHVKRFEDGILGPDGNRLKVPHMGWNRVDQAGDHPLWKGIESGSRFYFVHSYYCAPAEQAATAATTDYGVCFTSAVARANIFSVQFHPEKSTTAGLKLLENFVNWQP
jgi:imidazole glycerol phosphate synthase glutamine amidotransferase subunit